MYQTNNRHKYMLKSSSSESDKFYDNGSNNGITNDPAIIANAFNN